MDLPMAAAAAGLGISVDTLRRRLKAGQYESRRDPQGWILVTLADDVAGITAAPVEAVEVRRLEVDLSYTRQLLDETRPRAKTLERAKRSENRDVRAPDHSG